MREIKFKVLEKKTGIKVFLSHCEIGEMLSFPMRYERYVLLQYTGLKDINGVEIYEGDIVKYCYYREKGKEHYTNHTVEYIEVPGSDDMGTDMIGYNSEVSGGEVIGNIYQQPELLK